MKLRPWLWRWPACVRASGGAGGAAVGRDRRAVLRGMGLSLNGINPALERAFKVRGAKAVALSINSPGGSPVQSALIAARIRALAADKKLPVVAFIEDVGASGGYWLALAADEIFAAPARSSAASAWSMRASASPRRSSDSASSGACTRPARRRRCSTRFGRRTPTTSSV